MFALNSRKCVIVQLISSHVGNNKTHEAYVNNASSRIRHHTENHKSSDQKSVDSNLVKHKIYLVMQETRVQSH